MHLKKKKNNNCIASKGPLQWEIQVVSMGKANLWVMQPTMHAGCCVSIINQMMTWTTGSLMCTQMLIHVTAHGGVQIPYDSLHWKSTLGLSRKKIPCHSWESNLRRQSASPMLYQLNYIPTRTRTHTCINTHTHALLTHTHIQTDTLSDKRNGFWS